MTRIDTLPADHRAVTYLISRGCDITELGVSFGVSYCEFAEPRYRAAEDRIVAPVYMHGKLVGWQCRHIGELDWKELGIAKYYTRPGMPKRLTLYNFDSARTFPLVVLTEGISDVWAVGPQAVALLGSKLHTSQERLVCQAWGTGTVVVMLDPDARESAEDIVRRLEPRISGGVVPIHLDGVDPGDLSREALWAIIINQLEQHGYTMVRTNDDSDSSDSGLPVLRTASEQ